jgi:hypothetical protein
MHTTFLLESQKGRDALGDLGIDRRIILILILGKQGMRVRIEFSWFETGPSGGLL